MLRVGDGTGSMIKGEVHIHDKQVRKSLMRLLIPLLAWRQVVPD